MHTNAKPLSGQLLYAHAPITTQPGLLLMTVDAWVAVTTMCDLIRELRFSPVLISIPMPLNGLWLVWTTRCHHWLWVRAVPSRHGRRRNLKVVSGHLNMHRCSLRYVRPPLRLITGSEEPSPGSPRAAAARVTIPELAWRRTHSGHEPRPHR